MNRRPSTLLAAAVAAVSLIVVSQPVAAALPQPPGLEAGETYHLVFNSSTIRTALSSDIADYNAFVQAAADAAGIGASEGLQWTAIASTGSVDARDNAPVSGAVFDTQLNRVAEGFDDFWDGTHDAEIRYDETGEQNIYDTWTGSNPDGTGAAGLTLGAASFFAWCGTPTATDSNWITFLQPTTFNELAVYALSEPLAAIDADFDSNGAVDGADFLAWQRGFGAGHAATVAVTSVPEPSAGVLLAAAAMCVGAAVRGRGRRGSR